MIVQPATIKLFLTDGNPEGVRTAEISNWSGMAIAGPRKDLASLLKRRELQGSGVYLLTGVDPESDQDLLYIGESEALSQRMKDHRKRDDWNHAVAFLSKDENLTKGHVRFLEDELLRIAKEAGRSILLNSTNSGSSLPESDKADMEVYLQKALQLLPVLGVDLLKSLDRDNESATDLLYCQIKGLKAVGLRNTDGFIVKKGSQAVSENRPSAGRWGKKRNELIDQGVLVDKGGNLEFSKDHQFSSPSAAGAAVRGGSSNGLTVWKNSSGQTLKEIEESGDSE